MSCRDLKYDQFNGTLKCSYTYLADGTKVMVQDNAGSSASNGYLYLGSMVFKKTGTSYAFESTDFGGGRIINVNGTLSPYYYATDHLGSVRAITDASGNVTERNDYYAFGKRMTTGGSYPVMTSNRWKYNGKEVQTTGNVNWLDYGAREYDEVIGRWTRPDPKEEKYYSFTSYCYTLNNPGNNIDKQGDTVILNATTLPGNQDKIFAIATHTFISVKDNNGNIQNFAYGSEKEGNEGAFGGELERQFYLQDKSVANGNADEGIVKKQFIIQPPKGMTSQEFDKKVISVANSFGNNKEITYYFNPHFNTEGNCNTSTTTILYKSGVSKEYIKGIKKQIPGLSWGFGMTRPWTASEQHKAVNKQNEAAMKFFQSMLLLLQRH